jgi:hypothetical protein
MAVNTVPITLIVVHSALIVSCLQDIATGTASSQIGSVIAVIINAVGIAINVHTITE